MSSIPREKMKTAAPRNLFLALTALAVSSNATLIGMSTITNSVYEISPTTGEATLVSQLQENYAGIGLSFIGDRLFATDNLVHIGEPWDVRFTEIDLENGSVDNINGQSGSLNWHGLASNQTASVLYTIDINDKNTLKEISLDGSIRSIGAGTGIDGRGMDYDDNHGILYATDWSGGLYRVDVITGQSTLIGMMGIGAESIGLAYDEKTDVLYASAVPSYLNGNTISSLYSLNVSTGTATLIGSTNTRIMDGLAWFGETEAVPEPTTIILFGAGLLFLLFMSCRIRKVSKT